MTREGRFAPPSAVADREEGEIAVTGLGVICGLGTTISAFTLALREGRTSLSVSDAFGPGQLLDPARCRRLDPLSVWAVAAARQAAVDAGVVLDRGRPSERTAVAFGTALGCLTTALRYAEKLVEHGAYFTNPIDFPDSIDGAPAAHIAMELGIQGPSSTQVDGAVSGEAALLHGLLLLRSGMAQQVLVGAGDAWSPAAVGCLPGRNESRPDELGGGVGFLLLEAITAARRRGRRPYAILAGVGQATDPEAHPLRYSTNADASVRALSQACRGRGGEDLDLLSSARDGNGTREALEREAWRTLLGEHAVPVFGWQQGSGRGAGAGILRIIAACLTLRHGFVPGGEETRVRAVLHHALGRGGRSIGILLRAHPPEPESGTRGDP